MRELIVMLTLIVGCNDVPPQQRQRMTCQGDNTSLMCSESNCKYIYEDQEGTWVLIDVKCEGDDNGD